MQEKYKRNPNSNCFVCKKQVYKRPSTIKANKGRVFCSINCYAISNRKEIPCIVCGKPILAGLNKKTCSRECSNKHRAGIKYKQNSPRDNVKFYVSLKSKLAQIRGKICQRCEYNKFEILQVHHKDRNRSHNELENLELICPNCHFEEHFQQRRQIRELKKLGEVA